MPHQTVTATALARNFSDFLNQVRYQGVTLDVKRGNEIIACVSPPEARSGCPMGELDRLLAGLPCLEKDEAELFRRDMEQAVGALADSADPWDA